ncbi:hypothetical protein BOQ63_000790 (plasmid) [Streptomyces viridifaciens]|nr:hypothetical protein BOQ63_000790 [Streptomyces viridifaciens]
MPPASVYRQQFLVQALHASGEDLDAVLSTESILQSAGLSPDDEQAIVSHLVSTRKLRAIHQQSNGAVLTFQLTPRGMGDAMSLEAAAQDRARREKHLHRVLPDWIYNAAGPDGWTSLQTFAASEHWWFSGTEVTWNEVDQAVQYLQAKGVIATTVPLDGRVQLTAEGIDMVLSGTTVRSIMGTSRPAEINIQTYNNNGGQTAFGDHARQSMTTTTTTGVDTTGLLNLVSLLRANAPLLQLPQEDQDELIQEAEVIEDEARADAPDQGRIRRALGRVGELASKASANPLVQQMVSTAISSFTG